MADHLRGGVSCHVIGEDWAAASSCLAPIEGGLDRSDAIDDAVVRRVAKQFVVLDEIQAGCCDGCCHGCGRLRVETDARLDDGAEQRPSDCTDESAGPTDPERRPW